METIYVLMKAEPGSLEKVVSALKGLKDVTEVSAVTGAYDIFVKVEGKFISDVLSVVLKDLRKLPGVTSTETLVAVKM
jgi:DNA-binding Lrp family transcriptional regulator